MKIDMHLHSEYSPDSKSKISDIVKRAKQLDIGIAITDHNEILGSIKALETCNKVIPGIEVNCKEGFDILFYFSTPNELKDFYIRYIEPNKKKNKFKDSKLKAIELIKAAKKYNGFIALPHPYRIYPEKPYYALFHKKYLQKLIDYFDAMEIVNGKTSNVKNGKATMLALNKNKPILGGSDAHTILRIGKVTTELKISRWNIKTIFSEIKKGNSKVFIKKVQKKTIKKRIKKGNKKIKKRINKQKTKIKQIVNIVNTKSK